MIINNLSRRRTNCCMKRILSFLKGNCNIVLCNFFSLWFKVLFPYFPSPKPPPPPKKKKIFACLWYILNPKLFRWYRKYQRTNSRLVIWDKIWMCGGGGCSPLIHWLCPCFGLSNMQWTQIDALRCKICFTLEIKYL